MWKYSWLLRFWEALTDEHNSREIRMEFAGFVRYFQWILFPQIENAHFRLSDMKYLRECRQILFAWLYAIFMWKYHWISLHLYGLFASHLNTHCSLPEPNMVSKIIVYSFPCSEIFLYGDFLFVLFTIFAVTA